MLNRRALLWGSLSATVVIPSSVGAQPPGNVRRVGVLTLASRTQNSNPAIEGFQHGLQEHGYVDGQNVVVEIRWADGDRARLPSLAAELVRIGVDVILVAGPGPIQAARQATSSVPIVMAASSADPVAEGLAASLARPGGNLTGVTYAVSPERFAKQLELLKTAAPEVSRVAILWDLDIDLFRRVWAAPLRAAGETLGLEVLAPTHVRDAAGLPGAFAAMQHARAQGVLVATGGNILAARTRVGELAIQHGMATIAAFKEFPHAGGLMSYGPDLRDLYRKAGGYVARILDGARPGDLPIEQPARYEFVMNVKTARALGLTIPPSLLLRADQVIE